jgi:hypothetical protein
MTELERKRFELSDAIIALVRDYAGENNEICAGLEPLTNSDMQGCAEAIAIRFIERN